MKKYEFTGETKKICFWSKTVTLHKIRAIRDFRGVKAGDLGGWIEKEENLSHEGDCWVCDDAIVRDNAVVRDYAIVCDDAMVYGNANIGGDAMVRQNAIVRDDAAVHGNAIIRDLDYAIVRGNAKVCVNAEIFSSNHILTIGPIGSRNDFTTFYRDKDGEITVSCGCFLGKIDKFLEKVTETHGDSKHALVYRAAVELAKLQIELTDREKEK